MRIIQFKRGLIFFTIQVLVFSQMSCESKTDLDLYPKPEKTFRVSLDQRQLFLDDFGIQEMTNLTRKMHQPEKRGAVLKPDIPSDGYKVQIFSAPMWIPREGVYKLVYAAYPKDRDQIGSALAVSKDGIHWEKPNLGLKSEWQGSTENNRFAGDLSLRWKENRLMKIVYDPYDPDPSRRYKGFLGKSIHHPVVSPDCINWTKQKFCFATDDEDQRMALEIIRNRLADPGLANPLFIAPDPATGWQAPEEIRHIETWR